MVPVSRECGSAVLPVITIFAPSRAQRNAISRPMPRLAPGINIVFPPNDKMYPKARLLALENRSALLDESGHAFSEIARGGAPRESLRLFIQMRCQRMAECL